MKNILRSQLKRFDMNVNVFEEAQDVTTMKVYEFFSSLLTFKMDIEVKPEKKSKRVAFKSNMVDQRYQVSNATNETIV